MDSCCGWRDPVKNLGDYESELPNAENRRAQTRPTYNRIT